MTDLPRPGRRSLLAMLATLPAMVRAGTLLAAPPSAVTAPFAESPRLLVAGPSDGTLNRWADALLPALEQSLPPIRRSTGSRSAAPMVSPAPTSSRCAARRTGMTVAAGARPGGARLDGRRSPRAVRRGTLGAGDGRHELPAWLSAGRRCLQRADAPVSLPPVPRAPISPRCSVSTCLACRMEPVFGLADPTRRAALSCKGRSTRCCCVVTACPSSLPRSRLWVRSRCSRLARSTRPATSAAIRHIPRCRISPNSMQPHPAVGRRGPLCNAWSAAAAAAQLEFGLVLPQLTPAAMVALWRRAGVDAVASLGVQATAATVDVRPLGGPAATANTAATRRQCRRAAGVATLARQPVQLASGLTRRRSRMKLWYQSMSRQTEWGGYPLGARITQ